MSDWIEWNWTEEKPYPETLNTMILTRHENGISFDTYTDAETVRFWVNGINAFDPEECTDGDLITHYKLA